MYKFYIFNIREDKLLRILSEFHDDYSLSDGVGDCTVVTTDDLVFYVLLNDAFKENGLTFVREGILADRLDVIDILRNNAGYAFSSTRKYIPAEYLVLYHGYYIVSMLHHVQSNVYEGQLSDFVYASGENWQGRLNVLLNVYLSQHEGEIYFSVPTIELDRIGLILQNQGFKRVVPHYKILQAPYNCKLETNCKYYREHNCSCAMDLYYKELS